MEFSTEERVTITAWLIAAPPEVSVEDCRRRFHAEFNKESPPRQTLVDWKRKLLEAGSLVHRRPGQGRPKSACDQENERRVLTSINADPTNIDTSSVWRVRNVPDFSVPNSEEKSYVPVQATLLPGTHWWRRRPKTSILWNTEWQIYKWSSIFEEANFFRRMCVSFKRTCE